MSILLHTASQTAAQCDAPTAIGLVPPQTSTALVIKWPTVPGATQYQLRFWKTANPGDKTIVDDCGPSPITLRGLQKNTAYTVEVRTKCGNETSNWSPRLNSATINSSGSCNGPTGVLTSVESDKINLFWSSTGSHSVRYRLGNTGDWLIPTGALSIFSGAYTISGLTPGSYQIAVQRNCSGTASAGFLTTVNIAGACNPPAEPQVIPGDYSAKVNLPQEAGVLVYQVFYREGDAGVWLDADMDVLPGLYTLNAVLKPATLYQVQTVAVCQSGWSDPSPIATFTTLAAQPCLSNPNYGIDLSASEILAVDQWYNTPSPFNFNSMIGVNDGGLVFRSFQNESSNQITQLTTNLRNFHTMDEDFNASPTNYPDNIKPKETIPEGTPAHTARNKNFYTRYRLTHGFKNITGATEILQYGPQSWKEKIYKESDWSAAGPEGILQAYKNYTRTFIDVFAPANGTANQILVANYQVGNELWDYPIHSDYHSLLLGAREAFLDKYGPKANGGWKMKLVAGAFQAFRASNCSSMLRDFSNCKDELRRHDFIGDYLNVSNCNLLKDLDAVDCHPYSFKPETNTWTYPEDPESETWQIRNLAAWLHANQNSSTGVLQNTKLWSTEYGFDSYGVGEKTQSAYLLRGLLMHSRYHFEKVYFYNAYDVARETDQYYYGLYNSSGFWKLGTHPANSAWASPIAAHGATPKPAWFGMLDFKARFGAHVFHKALVQDEDAFVLLIAKPDSTEPYLVFWSPRQTNDSNLNIDIPIEKQINWNGAFSDGFTAEQIIAQTFAEGAQAGETFDAVSELACGSLTLSNIRRNPAFIPLFPCAACPNINQPGTILQPTNYMGGSPFDPGVIGSLEDASGGSGGVIVYQWQQSSDNSNFVDIPDAKEPFYDPPSLIQTTYFRRAAKRSNCTDFLHTPSIVIAVGSTCPKISAFERVPHAMPGCNPEGEYYYEIDLEQVSMNEQITFAGLPGNGINIPLCELNGAPLNTSTFQSNLHFVNNTSLQWQVKAGNGATQSLRLYYCWAENYPNPVALTTANSLCSGETTICIEGANKPDPEQNERTTNQKYAEGFQISLSPNPGSAKLVVQYKGAPTEQLSLNMVSATGQTLVERHIPNLQDQQSWEIDTQSLPPGIYFVRLKTAASLHWQVWEKF